MTKCRYTMIFATTCSLFASLHCGTCIAQRGKSFEGGATPWPSVSQGFPGYFDTNMAEAGSVVVDFPSALFFFIPSPSMTVDYGVSQTLTVGTNAIVDTVPWLFGAAGASVKVRSLVYGDDHHQSTATYYGGIVNSFASDKPVRAFYQFFTWNHSYRLATNHTITSHGNYGRMEINYDRQSSLDKVTASLTTGMVGGGYGYDINSHWSMRLNALFPIIQSLDADTASLSLSEIQTIGKRNNASVLHNTQTEIRLNSNWLLGVGVLGNAATGREAINIPYFSWARRW